MKRHPQGGHSDPMREARYEMPVSGHGSADLSGFELMQTEMPTIETVLHGPLCESSPSD
jgi:hypothetical protein